MNNAFDARLWDLLEKRKLANLSQYHQRGFVDEVPLYTRRSDLDFLADHDSANEVLLRFALRFLQSVIAFEQHRNGYFAGITLWHFPNDQPDGLLVPCLFAWCGPIRALKRKLALREVGEAFSKRIRKLVAKLRLPEPFSIGEDAEPAPGATRVFIAPAVQPYPGFATLDRFRPSTLHSK